jgi:WD40 repeat protein
MQFSFNGDFLATVDQTRPNIIWMWSLNSPTRLESALVHEHNVRHISWHPSAQELLIVTNNSALAAVHVWSNLKNPVIAGVPIARNDAGRYEVLWVKSAAQGEPSKFWFRTADDAVLGHVSVQDDGHGSFNMVHSVSRGGDLPQ